MFDFIVRKKFVLAGQTVNSSYCCDLLWRLLENVRRLRPELWRQKNWLLHHDNTFSHFLFHKGINFFPILKIKMKGRDFDTF
jgi:hypothetical protein